MDHFESTKGIQRTFFPKARYAETGPVASDAHLVRSEGAIGLLGADFHENVCRRHGAPRHIPAENF